MRLKTKSLILFLIPLLLSCASIQEKWNALSPDEKARIVINDLQTQLNDLFDRGKLYVTQNPQYQEKWKKEIVPTFDVANQTIKTAITISKTKGMTPDQVYAMIQPYLDKVILYLIQIGAIK